MENQYINDIDIDHYIDNGCLCVYCNEKRKEIYFRAKAGEHIFEKIIHNEVVLEVKNEKIKEINEKIKQINKKINSSVNQKKFKPVQFKINML